MNRRTLLLGTFLLLISAVSLDAQAAPRAADIVGKWELTVDSPQGTQVVTLTFAREDGQLTGIGEGQFGAFELADITVTGMDFAFVMRVDANGTPFDIPFKGKVTNAEAAEGTLDFSMNGESMTLPWKARRLPPG